jgi:hypothetical protein
MDADNSVQSPVGETRSDVGFPEVRRDTPRKGKFPIFVVAGIVILLVAGVIFLLSKPKTEVEQGGGVTVATPTPTTFEPTPTVVQLDKKELDIKVLNGTGISGLAAKVKTSLEKLGYTNIETSNADSKDYEVTEVRFSSKVSQEVRDEIIRELEKSFESVKAVGDSKSSDIEIITGYPKGHTATPTSKPSSTPTPTVSQSVTPTKTPTPTPQ